jgi:hypothetical protein
VTRGAQQEVVTDDELVRIMKTITIGFAATLVAVALLGVLYIVPAPVIGVTGLAVGVVMAIAAWVLPAVTTRWMAASAWRPAGVAGRDVLAVTRTIAFVGIALAEMPALIGLVLAVAGGHDVGAFVVSTPVAVVSLFVNASGPAAMRRHLERLRG